ncbi:MAG: ribosome biogenesis GTPase YlqF [Ruminococcaceae bacterium]|nr:ribosome biogenesis GTPase YlqF [Oscillospiraceae bacterium]
MPTDIIQWFPGHMAKTRRLIQENLKKVDLVIELLDARIPRSSRNPEIKRLIGDKPLITLLNKCSLADPAETEKWIRHYTGNGSVCIAFDCVTKKGLDKLMPSIRTLLADKLERYAQKGMIGRRLRAMVVGIPNVGKSSLINLLCGSKKAKVENRPGVTLNPQWVSAREELDLMDMPGVLWPRFDDRETGENLAVTGAIKDDVVEIETLAVALCRKLRDRYPALLCARYKVGESDLAADLSDYELFELIGKKRGFLVSGGEVNTERTANTLLDEFRAAKIGRITLDTLSKGEWPC